MSGAAGTAIVDFGSTYKNDASVAVTGQTSIVSGSLCEAWIAPSASADHTTDEHVMVASQLEITCSPPTAGVGFTIYAVTAVAGGLSGKWNLFWAWV